MSQPDHSADSSTRRNQGGIYLALVLLGAVLIVSLGIIIPLPPIVTGEEGIRSELSTSRVEAVAARYRFQQAMMDYQRFLATPPGVPDLPSELRDIANQLEAGGDQAALVEGARQRAQRVVALGEAMYPFARTSETYFQVLRRYEEDLMTWSRTLGPRSEQLRKATWPFIAWTQLYPEPLGLRTDIEFIAAEDIRMAVESVQTTVADLERSVTPALIRRVAMAAEPLWEAGNYLPRYAPTHDGYYSALREYDDQSVNVAATPEPGPGALRTTLAWAGTLVTALLLLVGLLLLFGPARLWRMVPRRRTTASASS